MTDRNSYTESDIDSIVKEYDYLLELSSRQKRKRHTVSICDPHRGLIMKLRERGKSAAYIKRVLSEGRVMPVINPPLSTLYDFIRKCESGE